MADKSPEERATQAAEALAAEGNPVTARGVQQRGQVAMNVASVVAREWNEQQAQARELPPMPETVTVRMQGIWRSAVEAARAEYEVEAEGWAARLKAAQDERDGALEDLSSAQKDVEAAHVRIAELEAAAETVSTAISGAEARAAAAEARAAAAEGVAAGLREALAAITPAKTS